MRWLVKSGVVALMVVLGLAATVVAAWAIDGVVHAGGVARNVVLDDTPVGGLSDRHVLAVIGGLASEYEDQEIQIEAPGRTFSYRAGDLGVIVDREATLQAVLEAGRSMPVPKHITSWAESFTADRHVALVFEVDVEALDAVIGADPHRVHRPPTDPSFEGAEGKLAVVPGTNGAHLGTEAVAAALEARLADGGPPFDVEVGWTPLPGPVSELDLAIALERYKALTAEPLVITVEGRSITIGPETIRRWVTSEIRGGTLQPVIVPDRVHASLEALVDITTPGTAPRFAVIGGEHVEILLGDAALTCCTAESVPAVISAVRREAGRTAEVALRPIEPDLGLGTAQSMGIVEVVGEFTTFHGCCASRVTNIQNIADIVRGAVIEPGGSFSINEFVGRRTRDKGFVSAGVIQNGHFTDGVGGGISQFATTMFNAAFFAGMELDEYQSHSIYISRYPYGREATMSFPHPDLAFTNPTPYSVLIWTSYTPTSITVELWSTQYFAVSQTGQSKGSVGACTRVTTFRERIAPDGSILEDSVFAVYRPGEGLDCAGRSTAVP